MRAVKVRAILAATVAALAAAATSLAATAPNAIGPATKIQPSGRQLAPYGRLGILGNHPGGGALTKDGRFLWALDSGRGVNDVQIIDVAPELGCRTKGKRLARCRKRQRRKPQRVIQTIPMPGLSVGIAMARDGRTAYVSGVADSEHLDQKAPPGTPGLEGDVIHVFKYFPKKGTAVRAGTIPVPPPSGVSPPQNFPPTTTKALSWPRDLAISKDGKTLLAALNLADRAAIVDLETKAVRYVQTGSYPYGA